MGIGPIVEATVIVCATVGLSRAYYGRLRAREEQAALYAIGNSPARITLHGGPRAGAVLNFDELPELGAALEGVVFPRIHKGYYKVVAAWPTDQTGTAEWTPTA